MKSMYSVTLRVVNEILIVCLVVLLMNVFPVRLQPEQDLRIELETLYQKHQWAAAWIVTCVGSVQSVQLRMAGAKRTKTYKGPFEITSLVGTLCIDGGHLHTTVSDATGKVLGGHLGYGSLIYTTSEIVIGYSNHFHFQRKMDKKTGFKELMVTTKKDWS